MSTILISLITLLRFSLFDYSLPSIDGDMINLSDYQGKKILLVNIASNSSQSFQLRELEIVYQQYRDSLIIIAFSSLDFGHESKSGEQLRSWYRDSLHLTFPISTPVHVKGVERHPIFAWAADKESNGMSDFTVDDDFTKYLVNRNGKIYAIYRWPITPMSDFFAQAIQDTNDY